MTTQPNVELLEKTMQHIVDHPEEHNQKEVWNACGAPACFVGWAQHFSGMTYQEFLGVDYSTEWAEENLGLTPLQACTIFSSANTIPMLQLMVKDVINGDELKLIGEYRKEAHPNG